MCGIAGFNWNNAQLIKQMTECLRHRGPDDEGFFLDSEVSLGHRRLAILDLSARGRQPMLFDNLAIVYNGEVYNFKELRKQLESEGYSFTSGTDTEVILYSYHKWGPSCVNRFNGMWALCIYDKANKTFFLSRDRFGIKPLYYFFDGNKFIFASELKAIGKHDLGLTVNPQAVNFFFYQKYIGGNLTIFNNCCKLKPSENLIFDMNTGRISVTRYYDLDAQVSQFENVPLKERLEMAEGEIVSAVERRLVADVPVGSFLSGGVDSSLISAIISKRHRNFDTFSIGFKDRSYNELEYSKLVSRHIRTEHHYEYMEFDENSIRFVLDNMDEPFGDASIFPTYLLSKITRRKVTVCLSGDAGDEVFGGYDTYKAYKMAKYMPGAAVSLLKRLVRLLPPSDRKVTLSFKIGRFLRDFGPEACKRHLNWMATFNDIQRRLLLGDRFRGAETFIQCGRQDSLLSLQMNDICNYLAEDILKKVDAASMLVALETRIPYLDYRLVPLILSLPEQYKIRCLKTKWLLKTIASSYLPQKIVSRPKRGFTSPISSWIRHNGFVRDLLVGREFYSHNLIEYDYVKRLFDRHISSKEDNARELWLVFVLNYWWRNVSREL